MTSQSEQHPENDSEHALARRSVLQMGGLGALALGSAPLLAACGSSKKASSAAGTASSSASSSAASASESASASTSATGAATKNFGSASVQFSWIKNIEFSGEYFADQKGYYKSAGFSGVSLIAGGAAGTSSESAVATGKALVGLTAPTITAPAILKGAKLKTIATTYQKNPFCIVSVARKPIPSVQDMKGKKIGVQAGGNTTIFKGLLKANGISESEVKIVPVQYDPTVVTTGEVDGFMAYITNEPILLAGKGFKPTTFLFADYDLPFVAETYVASDENIAKNRDKLKAFLVAEIKGWTDAVAAPTQSATYAVTMYGKDQKLAQKEQVLEATAQNRLIVSAESIKNGFGTISDALIAANIKALATTGVTITADKLFDMSLIKEVYQENPELIASFAKAAATVKTA